jgi:hypothetical protein
MAAVLEGMPVSITDVKVPEGSAERRSPVAIVGAFIGQMHIAFTVSSLKGNNLLVRPPLAAGSAEPGVSMPPDLARRVSEAVIAAVKADPEAAHVLSRGKVLPVPGEKVGGHKRKQGKAAQ